jgi:hypothetical protein
MLVVSTADIGHGQLDLEAFGITEATTAPAVSSGGPVLPSGGGGPAAAGAADFELGHARNSSAASRVSGYASMPGASHSRQSSSGDSAVAAGSTSHMR